MIMKKKALVAGVLLSVFSTGMSAQAATYSAVNIDSDKDIHYVAGYYSASSYTDEFGNLKTPELANGDDVGIAINVTGSNDKKINFIVDKDNSVDDVNLGIDYDTVLGNSIGILNNSYGATVMINSDRRMYINNNPYVPSDFVRNINSQYAIKNEAGHLIINNDLSIGFDSSTPKTAAIRNESSASLDFNGEVSINDFSEVSTENFAIENDGGLNFENGLSVASVASIKNNGSMSVKNGLASIYGYTKINNDVGETYGTNIENNGELIFDVERLYLTGTVNNNGALVIANNKMTDGFSIKADIIHGANASTTIDLKGILDSDGIMHDTVLNGQVKGSSQNDKFKLTLGDGATWITNNQTEIINGLELNGGVVSLAQDLDSYWSPHDNWDSVYSNLSVMNLKSNGDFSNGGGFIVYTDLANDVGDKVTFMGSTPNTKIPFLIINKNDNNGIDIKPSDGHKVTIADTRGLDQPTSMEIEAKYVYLGDSKLYKSIIETVDGSPNDPYYKAWNFVGWQEEGYKTVNEEIKQTNIEPWINYIELDNTLKRINDIRTDPSEVGAWLRGENGKMKIRSYGYKYNLMSGGYDWKYESDAAKMFLGFGISYAKNNCDTGIIGDTKSMGYNLYGSWLGRENNDYVDVIVKYGTLDKKYAGLDDNNVFVTGDYDKKLFSVAAKYGRRITRDDGWYYEPSVGLTWGRIGSADFTDSQGIKIHADSSTSKMATLGMQVGKNIQGTEFYGLFQVRHDFDGKMHVNVPGSDLPGSSVYDDMGGTWYKVGIGAARKINKNNSFYMDIEKDFGNKVKKPYAIGAGYRYTF